VALPYCGVVYTLTTLLDTSVFAAQTSALESGRYNVLVSATQPKRQPPDRAHDPHTKLSIHRLEATGILVIAILLLILTLIRYWRYIPWSAR